MIKEILVILTLVGVVLSLPDRNSDPEPEVESDYEEDSEPESEANPKLAEGEKERMRARILEMLQESPGLYRRFGLETILELTKVSRSKCHHGWHIPWIANVNLALTDPELKHFYIASLVRQLKICSRIVELVVQSKVQRLPSNYEAILLDMLEKAEELGYGDDEESTNQPQSYLPEYIRAKTALVHYLKERQTSSSSRTPDITLDEVEAKAQTHIILPCRDVVPLLTNTFDFEYSSVAEAIGTFGLNIRQPPAVMLWFLVFNWCDKVLQGYKEWTDSQN